MANTTRGIDTKATEELQNILNQWKDEDAASSTSGQVKLFTPVQSQSRKRSNSTSRKTRNNSAEKTEAKGDVSDPFTRRMREMYQLKTSGTSQGGKTS
jgi:hypothetical protein